MYTYLSMYLNFSLSQLRMRHVYNHVHNSQGSIE